jgi:N-methylhydantoinase A/oxoprolinase/acetone carboxylase beta subunit
VPLPGGAFGPASLPQIVEAFGTVYRRLYGRVADAIALEAVNWRVVASGPAPSLDLRRTALGEGTAEAALKGHRPVYFPQFDGYHETPVYDRYRLGPGAAIAGPAIVEERESTAVIGPSSTGIVDGCSNLIVRTGHES